MVMMLLCLPSSILMGMTKKNWDGTMWLGMNCGMKMEDDVKKKLRNKVRNVKIFDQLWQSVVVK